MQKEYSTKFKALFITAYTIFIGFLGTVLAPYVGHPIQPVKQTITPTQVVTPEVSVSASPSATTAPSVVPSKAVIKSFIPVAKPTGK